jgi:serine/threonine-protein kinase PpkA
MLIGKRPYVAKTIPEIIEMHRNSPPPTLPAEHATFQTLIDRLLAKEPEQRFHDATQLLLALDSFGSARAGKTAEFARA